MASSCSGRQVCTAFDNLYWRLCHWFHKRLDVGSGYACMHTSKYSIFCNSLSVTCSNICHEASIIWRCRQRCRAEHRCYKNGGFSFIEVTNNNFIVSYDCIILITFQSRLSPSMVRNKQLHCIMLSLKRHTRLLSWKGLSLVLE